MMSVSLKCLLKSFNLSVEICRTFSSTKPAWELTISEAKRLVSYPSSLTTSTWLMSDEITNNDVTLYLRQLVNHPSLQIANNLLHNEQNSMQTWRLVILLMLKAAGFSESFQEQNQDKSCGVLHKQKALIEITEMIRTAYVVHNSLENLNGSEFGTKFGLLTGDYLLGKISLELSKLRKQRITELMWSAVRDLAESEFFGERDQHNNPLPYKPSAVPSTGLSDLDDDSFETDCEKPLNFERCVGIPDKEWEAMQMLKSGSLLAKSCQCSLNLAGLPENVQKYGYFFGKHFALAGQASVDLEVFYKSSFEDSSTFSLIGAPVLFHLNFDPSSYEEIVKDSIDKVNYKKLHAIIRSGPALEFTKDLQLKHVSKTLKVLKHFPPSEARTALENILLAMEDI